MNYETILEETRLITAKYSLDNIMLKGFTPELIKLLMQNHIEKIKMADNYKTSIDLINDALNSKFSAGMVLDDFITDVADRCKLYSLFAQWRSKLLEEMGIQN